MGVKERREREREVRRRSVLDAARDLVREYGFNSTTTKKIAERCELSEAALFWYFRSKDEILTSLLFEGIDFMARGLEEIGATDHPRERILPRLWDFFGEVLEAHPEYYQLFSYLARPHSTAAVDDEVKAEIARRSGDNFRTLADHLAEVVGPADSRAAADLLWGSFVGLIVLRDSRANLGAKAHPTSEEMAATFQLLLRGFASERR